MLESLMYYFLSQPEQIITSLLRERPEVASLEWRAANVRFFNELLGKACEAHNSATSTSTAGNTRAEQQKQKQQQLVYLDVNAHMLDASGRITRRFLMDDPCNVHVKWGVTLPYWLRLLESVGLRRAHLLQRPLGYVDGFAPRRLLLASRRHRHRQRIARSPAVIPTRCELATLLERAFSLPPFQTAPPQQLN